MGLKTRLASVAVAIGLLAASQFVSGRESAMPVPDGWSAAEFSLLKTLLLDRLAPAVQDPSNAVETKPEAAALGQKLFFDKRLSANGQVACASCHAPEQQFQDSRPLGVGIGTGNRRTMPIIEAGRSAWLFWDGRKDSLWSQALGPMEDAAEHGGNRVALVRTVLEHYPDEYRSLFGRLPDSRPWPAGASPLGPAAQRLAWSSMTEQQREEVSRAFANIGKVIAAYEKTLKFDPSRLDRYIAGISQGTSGATGILSDSEKRGLRIFIGKAQCITCHSGPLLTDLHFHNTGVRPREGKQPDQGRSAAITAVLRDEFNCLGKYSDAARHHCAELEFIAADDPHMVGAFKTPSLRDVARRAPYMHAGQVATLAEAVRHYAKAPAAAVGHNERKPMQLTDQEATDLVNFLSTLH